LSQQPWVFILSWRKAAVNVRENNQNQPKDAKFDPQP